ncbi:NAD(P)-dependent alcohol dehydrogenase [Lentzea sp. NPDC058450]|uniref:NAD(P)-dependent alcohol dehydrogenase n=1 Tax=Lentzea sp. NPDC058450 TaxID=3346505 RepID=UPI00364D9FEE
MSEVGQRTAAAVVSSAGADFVLRDVELDEPGPGEVLVRVEATGMCHADLAARDGDFPFPLPGVVGHEGAGVVERVGPGVTSVRPGQRVIMTFDSCGACQACLAGVPSQCAEFLPRNFTNGPENLTLDGQRLHGGFFGQSSFAGHALSTVRNTVAVPDVAADLPGEVLAPLGCGIQTGAGAVLNVLKPAAGGKIAVFGAGVVGLSAVMAAALLPLSEIVVIDVHDSRLDLARKLGATEVINARLTDPVAALKDLTGGGPGYVVESSGVPAVFVQALKSLRIGGAAAIVGVPPFGVTAPVDVADLVNDSKRVLGVVEGESNPPLFLPMLAEMVADGRMPVGELVETFALADVEKAAEAMKSGRVVKPVVIP